MMKSISLNCAAVLALALTLAGSACAQENPALFLGRANARVARASAFRSNWDGPVSGPKIASKRLIVFIGSDFRNSGVAGVAAGTREAAAMAGWEVATIDCYGVPSRHAEAFSRAMALKPAGIILAGIDAQMQAKEMRAAAGQKIPVVGWHAATKTGPADGLYTNVTTDPKEVGQIAALLGIVESKGKAGVVVFADSSSLYASAKSNEIVDIVRQCQTCSLLGVEDVPLTEAAAQLQQRVAALHQKYGAHWTQLIGINDAYFDALTSPAALAILAGNKLQAISAGDGSRAAYQRIRGKTLQIGTVPEPLNMQGWQLIDELNRAIAGQKPSGYETPAYLVTSQNIAFHGGQQNSFEPSNGYRSEYKKIWKK